VAIGVIRILINLTVYLAFDWKDLPNFSPDFELVASGQLECTSEIITYNDWQIT